jgi:hypothetical protein
LGGIQGGEGEEKVSLETKKKFASEHYLQPKSEHASICTTNRTTPPQRGKKKEKERRGKTNIGSV